MWWEWVFSGVGVLGFSILGWFFRRYLFPTPSAIVNPIQATATTRNSSPAATGSNITQQINSHNVHVTLPTQPSLVTSSSRETEWRELIHEIHEALERMCYAFMPVNVISFCDDRNDAYAGIARGDQAIRNRLYIADALKNSGLIEEWKDLVTYVHSRDVPREPNQRGCPTRIGFDLKARAFEDRLVQVARDDLKG